MLILIRGLPGSGKTKLARKLASERGCLHLEADMYFVKWGNYRFEGCLLKHAHSWCFEQAEAAIIDGFDVIVSNTFTTRRECEPYLESASLNNCAFEVISLETEFKSIHGVPPETLQRMRDRWEIYPWLS